MITREQVTLAFKTWNEQWASGENLPEGFYTEEENKELDSGISSLEEESAIYFLALLRNLGIQ